MPFVLYQKTTPHAICPINAYAPSLASKLLHEQFDESFVRQDINSILPVPGHLSLEHKQNEDSSLHESTAGGAHRTMQLQGRGEGTSGR